MTIETKTALHSEAIPVVRSKPILHSLTGLRFLAAMLVFNCHYLKPSEWWEATPSWIKTLIASGSYGIELFFVLSGFILVYSYDQLPLQKVAIKAYLVARFARIYPVYLLGFVLFGPFILTHRFLADGSTKTAVLKSLASGIDTLLLTQSWFHPRFAGAWNGPSWTLSVEAFFYLLFPWINAWLRRLSPRQLALFTGLTCIAQYAIPAMLTAIFHNSDLIQKLILKNPLSYVPTFVVGMCLARIYQIRSALNTERRDGSFLALAGLILFGVIMSRVIPMTHEYQMAFSCVIASGMIIYGLAKGGWLSRFFSMPGMVLLGESSYALYLLQFGIYGTITEIAIFPPWQDIYVVSERMGPLYYLICLTVSVTVSILVFKYIETPARIWIRSRFGSPAKKTKAADFA